MRKRKRGFGTYLDEDTGEVSTVQTTKEAKREHKKSGKWYKEPTESEIRAWDREEAQQQAADKAAKREQNKKINSVKRIEQAAKDQESKRSLFEAGKITFTQTLAKKDEDQQNLHSWFGGCRTRGASAQQTKEPLLESEPQSRLSRANEQEICDRVEVTVSASDKENVNDAGSAACDDNSLTLLRTQSSERDNSLHIKDDPLHGSDVKQITKAFTEVSAAKGDFNRPQSAAMAQLTDADIELLNSTPDFKIAEDTDAGTEVVEHDLDEAEQDTYTTFKIPALPHKNGREPLSPLSDSDLNVRATQMTKISSLKDKLAAAKSPAMFSSTQAVRDVLTHLSTQDLDDDIIEDILNDKENDELKFSQDVTTSPIRSMESSPLRTVENAIRSTTLAQSFNSLNESFDYDSIFAELEAPEEQLEDDDFCEDGLDDATLLSLPATQITASARKAATRSLENIHKSAVTEDEPSAIPEFKKKFQKYDSFAVEGLDDTDLLAGLEQYENALQGDSSLSTCSSKKRRVLPWERQDWTAATTGVEDDVLVDDHPTQATQLY